MPLQQTIETFSAPPSTPFLLPTGTLETLAARIRTAGILLVALRPDGTQAYADQSASPFFQQFALPLLDRLEFFDPDFALRLRSPQPDAPASISEAIPGLVLAAIPYAQRRQVHGVLLLVAKHQSFSLGEDILRAATQLHLDAAFLGTQAAALPGYDSAAMFRQAEFLSAMLRDQLRLRGVEQELTSLSSQLANTYEELNLIYQISGGMRVNRRAADFFRQACLDVLEVISVRGMGVTLERCNLAAQAPALYGNHDIPVAAVERLSAQLTDVLVQRKSLLLINDLNRDPQFSWLAAHARQLIAVPLQRQDQVLGCLFALDKNEGDFDSIDAKLLNSIANESAIYLENAILFEDVHGLMMGLLHSLTSAVDAKDTYTCGHSERVALLSRHLAQRAGLPDNLVERIYMAGILHDVGKIGVPEAVLQKTGKLTDEEFAQMKKHPEIGARILRDIKQIEDILPGVLHHHERYDGRGYPAGLTGESIPLMGRIICLADCFDAMTSNRTYRKALPLEVALDEIRRNAGTQFDPTLAEVFLNMGSERLRAILNEYQASNGISLQFPTDSQEARSADQV